MPDLRADAIAWLLQGDPAVRWQCLRDLVQAPPAAVARERERVATAGWGARLLAQQDPAGTWASGGLAAWEHLAGRSPGVAAARRRGEEFLLLHRRCRSHTTGAVARPAFTRLAFPPHWQYDVRRARDDCRAAAVARDARLAEAIALLRSRQLPSGRWPLQQRYAGAAYFDLEVVGAPSRWNTLRALRVLDWWDGG